MNESSFMSRNDVGLIDSRKDLNMSTKDCSLRQSRPVSISASRMQPKSEINESSLEGEESDAEKQLLGEP